MWSQGEIDISEVIMRISKSHKGLTPKKILNLSSVQNHNRHSNRPGILGLFEMFNHQSNFSLRCLGPKQNKSWNCISPTENMM